MDVDPAVEHIFKSFESEYLQPTLKEYKKLCEDNNIPYQVLDLHKTTTV